MRPARRRAAEPDRAAHALEGLRLRGAARRLRGRGCRRPPPSSSGAGRRRACRRRRHGSRRPRCASRASTSRRPSPSASACAQSLAAAGYDCPETPRQLRLAAVGGAARRASRGGGARRPDLRRGDPDLAAATTGERRPARGARRDRRPVGRAEQRSSCARAARPRSRIVLDLDGTGRARVATGIGFLDHLLTLFAFHGSFDLEVLAGGDLDVDEHHTVEDVLAALGDALCERARRPRRRRALRLGVGADGRGARDRGGRPRPPPARGDRRSCSPATGSAGSRRRCSRTRSSGWRCRAASRSTSRPPATDDHHVAEAAFKALGQALRQACAPGGEGIRSTKGLA